MNVRTAIIGMALAAAAGAAAISGQEQIIRVDLAYRAPGNGPAAIALPIPLPLKYIVRRYIFCHSSSVFSGFPDENFSKSAGDIVAKRGVDDCLDHFRRRIGLADSFQDAVLGANLHRQRQVMRRGRFVS